MSASTAECPRQELPLILKVQMSVTLSPEYLATLTSGERHVLASQPDFVEACLADGTTPAEALELDNLPAASQVCRLPVVMNRENVTTGEVSEVILPCRSSNALKCPPCAELNARLRQRQIMNGLEKATTDVALFTNTAPSFGQVHRSSYSAKDAYKVRNFRPDQRAKNRLTVMKRKGACPCGGFHDWQDFRIGTPLNPLAYGYASEVMWSENLPNLTKSMTRTIRRLAVSLGIDKDALSLYTVYERQKRGSLHTHSLIVVDGNSSGFEALVAELKTNWKTLHNPTAEIPQNRVTYYRSPTIQQRWRVFSSEFQRDQPLDTRLAIPRVRWKKGQARPGTQFGKVWDIRILKKDQDDSGELTGHQQAAGYLSKYLTKNQSATSLAAIEELSSSQARHFTALRQATLAIAGDRVIAESQLANCLGEVENLQKKLALTHAELSPDACFHELERVDRMEQDFIELLDELADLKNLAENIPASGLMEHLFKQRVALNVTAKDISSFTDSMAVATPHARRIRQASRGTQIRLNKVLDNAGFSGALTSISNWETSMTDLREEMRNFASGSQLPSTDVIDWSLDTDRMRELALDRYQKREPRAKPADFKDFPGSSLLYVNPPYVPPKTVTVLAT